MKHKAIRIELERVEGPAIRPGRPVNTKVMIEDPRVQIWAEADANLIQWSFTAPKKCEHWGCHKCDYIITYDNGHTFSGQFDLQQPYIPGDLAQEIRGTCLFWSGRRRPPNMPEGLYYDILCEMPYVQVYGFGRFLDEYEIGGR